jgi:SAM-dependent methyltransferase
MRSNRLSLIFSVDVIHHVRARAKFIGEAYRSLKAGGKLCTVTDSAWIIRNRQPLSTYFPESVDKELARYPRIPELRQIMAEAGFHGLTEELVEIQYELTDLQPYRDRAFSSLHLISEQAYQAGMAHMQADLRRGPILCVARYLLLWGAK